MPQNKATAVVVLGHGSRAAGAAEALEAIAERLGEALDFPVRAASLQFNHPDLSECCRELASAGAGRIIIAPYFLFNGNHIRKDIPEEIEALEREFPEVEFIMAGGLGEDGRLAEILGQRVMEAIGAGETAEAGPPAAIEAMSFTIIDDLLGVDDNHDPAYQVTRRVVHATGDPGLAPKILVPPGAVESGLTALREGAPIVCDVNMVAAGISPTAERLGIHTHCGVATDGAAALARAENITRSAAALRLFVLDRVEKATPNPVVAIGNAPTALYETLSLQRQGLWQPALIVGVPVGFVDAAESKQELARSGLAHITIPGNRGGSSIAVAIVNALLKINGSNGMEE